MSLRNKSKETIRFEPGRFYVPKGKSVLSVTLSNESKAKMFSGEIRLVTTKDKNTEILHGVGIVAPPGYSISVDMPVLKQSRKSNLEIRIIQTSPEPVHFDFLDITAELC